MDVAAFEPIIPGAVVRNFFKLTNLCLPRKVSPLKYYGETKTIDSTVTDFVLSSVSSSDNTANVQIRSQAGVSVAGQILRYRRLQQIPGFSRGFTQRTRRRASAASRAGSGSSTSQEQNKEFERIDPR
ncbi:hypothetical protein PG985_012736 [Apiospora marii]|uniref:Uncharacterized protein n=1 Tax=Apiospora marii TaxID=335849 RepID=A0ABR1RDE7_9PEZI